MLTRRHLLRSTSASAALLGLPFTALAFDDDPVAQAGRPTLVVVFLRGGMDGMNLLVPFGDPDYGTLRPGIGIRPPKAGETQNRAVDLDGFFGLHPAAAAWKPLFEEGLAIASPAVGHAGNTRSHFEEQDLWETAVSSSAVSTSGWLNRHLATSKGRGTVRALALGDTLPRSLRGDVSALSLRGLDDLTFPGAVDSLARTMEALDKAYDDRGTVPASLTRGGRGSLEALKKLQEVALRPDTSKVEFPDTDLGRRAREASRLIRADLGLEVIELDFGGWDTHQNQGGANGPYANNVRQLTEALTALVRDVEDHLDNVMIVTVTEFGRTAAQNGTNGTDHGWASCSFAFGGPVHAKKHAKPTVGTWPGLAREQRNQNRDLAHTVDFRDVYGELLGFLGNRKIDTVLPGHKPAPVGWI